MSLDDGAECLPGRCIPDLTLQPRALALQLCPFGVERSQILRLLDPNRPSPDDGKRNGQKSRQYQTHDAATTQTYAAFRHARSLALRERGLFSISAVVALIAFFVIS